MAEKPNSQSNQGDMLLLATLLVILLDPAEAELLALGRHLEEVIQARFKEIRMTAGVVDVGDADADVSRRERLEVLPGGLVGLDGFKDIGRNDELILFFFGQSPQRRENVFCDSSLLDHFLQPLDIRLGIRAFRVAPGKALGEAFVIHFFQRAVDPTEADRFLDGVVIGNARFSRIFLVIDEPDPFFFFIILPEPGAPFPAGRHIKSFIDDHFSSYNL